MRPLLVAIPLLVILSYQGSHMCWRQPGRLRDKPRVCIEFKSKGPQRVKTILQMKNDAVGSHVSLSGSTGTGTEGSGRRIETYTPMG